MLQTKLVNAVEREKKIGKEYTFMSNMDGKIFRWPSIRELARIAHCKKNKREKDEDELIKLVTVMGSELREEMELMCSSAKINKQNAIVESTKKPFTWGENCVRKRCGRVGLDDNKFSSPCVAFYDLLHKQKKKNKK